MKFKDLFNGDKTLNWKKISSLKEFSNLKDLEEGSSDKKMTVLFHTQKVVDEMGKMLSSMSVDPSSGYYTMMIVAALCHDIGRTTNMTTNESGVNGSNICRRLFYDENTILREKVCYMIRTLPNFITMFTNDMVVRTIMKTSWGLATVEDMLTLFACEYRGGNYGDNAEWLNDKLGFVKKMASDIKCYNNKYDFDNKSQKNSFFYQMPDDTQSKKGKRFTVYFMVGLPGAGKDTYISKKLHGIPTVCRDDIRTEIGIKGQKPQGTKKEEDLVTKLVNERIVDLCEKRASFIINNTNLKKEYRDSFEKMILPYKPKIVFIYVEAPNVNENKNRRSGQIPPSVIERMSKNLDFPEPYEYDEIRYDIQR